MNDRIEKLIECCGLQETINRYVTMSNGLSLIIRQMEAAGGGKEAQDASLIADARNEINAILDYLKTNKKQIKGKGGAIVDIADIMVKRGFSPERVMRDDIQRVLASTYIPILLNIGKVTVYNHVGFSKNDIINEIVSILKREHPTVGFVVKGDVITKTNVGIMKVGFKDSSIEYQTSVNNNNASVFVDNPNSITPCYTISSTDIVNGKSLSLSDLCVIKDLLDMVIKDALNNN